MRGGILIKALAFAYLAKADRDEHGDSFDGEKDHSDPLVDPNFYIDQLKAIKRKAMKLFWLGEDVQQCLGA